MAMQIIKVKRQVVCNGSVECENIATNIIHFGKKKVYLCGDCMRELHNECAGMLAPRSIKSKFNNIKGRKI